MDLDLKPQRQGDKPIITLIYNKGIKEKNLKRLNKFGFQDETSHKYQIASSMNNDKIRKLSESKFHVFLMNGK